MRLTLVLIWALSEAVLQGQTKKYSITGELVFDNGAPVARAEVSLFTTEWTEAADPVLSDAAGHFAFRELPQGTFLITATRHDLGQVTWGQTPQADIVSALTLGDEFPSHHVVFRIERPATIVGIVKDAAGNLLPHVQVTTARRTFGNGKAVLKMDGGGQTNEMGGFRVPFLHPGRYRICAVPQQIDEPVLPVGFALFGQSPREVYGETCVPDSLSGDLLTLKAGARVELELSLSAKTPLQVSGRVAKLDHQIPIVVSLELAGVPNSHFRRMTQTSDEANNFSIENVLPGKYWLRADLAANGTDQKVPLGARIPLTVSTSSISGLELTLAPLPVIGVVLHGPEGAEKVEVGLRDADDAQSAAIMARPTDGSLRISLPHAGRYWLVTRSNLCPSKARFNNANVLQGALPVSPGAAGPLDITVTDQCGEISGVAIDAAGKPVAHARNLILASGTPDDPGDFLLTSAEEDGTFSYWGFLPGTYQLWAWAEASEWSGEVEDLGRLKGFQTSVEVKAGEKQPVRVTVIGATPGGKP